MDQPSKPTPRDGDAALIRLRNVLRQELRTRSAECRYSRACPVLKKGNCPGIC